MKAHSGIRRQKTYLLLEKEEGPSHGSKTHEMVAAPETSPVL